MIQITTDDGKSGFVGIDGNLVEKDIYSHPYSYDMFLVDGQFPVANEKDIIGIYSDRLYQRDSKRYNELMMKHVGSETQDFSGIPLKKIEAFLREFENMPELNLIRIFQGCNVSNGYPLWLFQCSKESK